MFGLQPLRHISTLPLSETQRDESEVGFLMTELPSVDCSACGSANDPRCGGRGRDQGGNHARRDPSTCWPFESPLEQGPAHRPETSSETKGGLGDPRPAPA